MELAGAMICHIAGADSCHAQGWPEQTHLLVSFMLGDLLFSSRPAHAHTHCYEPHQRILHGRHVKFVVMRICNAQTAIFKG